MRTHVTWLLASIALAACASSSSSSEDSDQQAIDALDDSSLACVTSYVNERSPIGLQITPVALDLTGKSKKQVDQIGYGSYLVNAASPCSDCHTAPGGPYMAGGLGFPLDAAGHVVFARNLTPDANTGMQLTEAQFIAAMRTGKDFHAGATQIMLVMPWQTLRWTSDGDLKAMYAYLKAIPAVPHATPPDNKVGMPLPPAVPFPAQYNEGDVTRNLPYDDGQIGPNLKRGIAIQPLAQPSLRHLDVNAFSRGSYLVNTLGACNSCHTQNERDPVTLKINTALYLGGGQKRNVPPPLNNILHQRRTESADLIGATHGFFHEDGVNFEEFKNIIRTGTHADETPPRPLGFPMPAADFRHMADDDLFAIFEYMTHVTPRTGAGDHESQDYSNTCNVDADCGAGRTCNINPAIGNECLASSCDSDADCAVCQTCDPNAHACLAPVPGSACLLQTH